MKEGRRLKGIDPINAISAFIMPDRIGSSNQFTASVNIEETENFIRQKRAEGKKGIGLMHVFMAAYVRTVAKYPAANRFIRGQRVYARNGISMCLTVKKKLELNAPETVIKIPANPDDTIDDIYERTSALIENNKNENTRNGTDSAAKILAYIPGVFLKFVVWFLKLLDYFGLLPKALINLSPFHGSMFLTNMGSLGIPPIYHHLYNFGNLPMFFSIGAKRTEYKVESDGSVKKLRLVDITVVCDERICDGHYYATAFKTLKRNIEKPYVLDSKPDSVTEDIR